MSLRDQLAELGLTPNQLALANKKNPGQVEHLLAKAQRHGVTNRAAYVATGLRNLSHAGEATSRDDEEIEHDEKPLRDWWVEAIDGEGINRSTGQLSAAEALASAQRLQAAGWREVTLWHPDLGARPLERKEA
jgi:hypothetical protein